MLKPINSAFSQWLKKIRELPQTVAKAAKERQQNALLANGLTASATRPSIAANDLPGANEIKFIRDGIAR